MFTKFWQMLSGNYIFALIIFIIGVILTAVTITITEVDKVKIANKILAVGSVLVVYMFYKFFHHKPSENSEQIISESPNALAIEHGFLCLSVAIAVTFA